MGGVPQAEEIQENTYYNWRRQYGGLKLDQAKRLMELELENSRLRSAVATLTLDKQILSEAPKGKSYARRIVERW